ncbi:MAG: hypothetical protein ACE5EX_05600 [Phycisphaerae bacterium]
MDLLGLIFATPIPLSGLGKVILVFPICLSISVVYKATRLERLRELPSAVLGLWVTIVVGMYAVGVGLWVVFLVMHRSSPGL